MYLVRVWDVYAYHKVRVRALAMAIVRTMVPNGTNGTIWYHGTCVHTRVRTHVPLVPPNNATLMYLECEPFCFRLRRALRQPRVARLIGK